MKNSKNVKKKKKLQRCERETNNFTNPRYTRTAYPVWRKWTRISSIHKSAWMEKALIVYEVTLVCELTRWRVGSTADRVPEVLTQPGGRSHWWGFCWGAKSVLLASPCSLGRVWVRASMCVCVLRADTHGTEQTWTPHRNSILVKTYNTHWRTCIFGQENKTKLTFGHIDRQTDK